jgi:hypothetical protein
MKKLGLSANLANEKKKESATPNSKNPSETGRKNGYRKTSFPEKKASLKTAGGKKTCKDDDVLRETNCKLFTTCECRPFLLTPATLILAVAAATAAAADSKRQYSLVESSHPALPIHVVRCNDETKSEVEDEEEGEEEEEEEANDDKSRAGIATTSAHTHTQAQEMPATRSGSSYGASELVLERLLELLEEIEHSRILQAIPPHVLVEITKP